MSASTLHRESTDYLMIVLPAIIPAVFPRFNMVQFLHPIILMTCIIYTHTRLLIKKIGTVQYHGYLVLIEV